MDRTTIDLLQGTLSVLIMKSLTWGPMHGYGIARWIEQVTNDELLIDNFRSVKSMTELVHRLRSGVPAGWGT